jgi:hypothetical protein
MVTIKVAAGGEKCWRLRVLKLITRRSASEVRE